MSRDTSREGQLVGGSLKFSNASKCQRRWSKQHSKATSIRSTLVLFLLSGVIYFLMNLSNVQADDSAAAPAFDMGTLASLASNLGSNPQIMSLVSSFLNPVAGQQKASVGSTTSASSSLLQSDLSPNSDLETNSIAAGALDRVEPLRRGTRVSSEQQVQGAATAAPAASGAISSTATSTTATSSVPQSPSSTSGSQTSPSAPSNSLNGLMSMLPGMLSGLAGSSGGGLNLGGLSSLLGLGKSAQASAPAPTSSDATQSGAAGSNPAAAAQPAQQASSTGATNQPVTAQQVINLVLTSYASGQIPSELIQLGLSGRVPPAIIELALSGQVPLDMIRMVITGQVPISTINGFLGAMQQAQQVQPAQAGASGAASLANRASNPGFFAATRNLFEALFSLARPRDASHPESSGRPAITVPTLIGPIPLRMPSLPNMRSIGQLVGGTISNFSSMIPF